VRDLAVSRRVRTSGYVNIERKCPSTTVGRWRHEAAAVPPPCCRAVRRRAAGKTTLAANTEGNRLAKAGILAPKKGLLLAL